MTSLIDLENGKYTVVDSLSEGGRFYAQRYGEDWRDLTGDNLILAMFYEIESLRHEVNQLTDNKEQYDSTIKNMDALADSVRYCIGELPNSETIADKIVELISNLERKVGEIV